MGTKTVKLVPMSKLMVPITLSPLEYKEMEKITDTTLRKLVGTSGETKTIAAGGGLQLWVTVNQAGKTLKSWVLRYYDAVGKRQKARIGVIFPFLVALQSRAYAACFNFMAGVMPPMPMFGRSLL